MSTSDINKNVKSYSLENGIKAMIAVSVLCLIFAVVYNHFGHNVYSVFMSYMFLIPTVLGIVVYGLLIMLRVDIVSRMAFNLYNSGIATLIVGSCLKGIFEIAGTNSPMITVYWIVGGGMVVVSIIMQISFQIRQRH